MLRGDSDARRSAQVCDSRSRSATSKLKCPGCREPVVKAFQDGTTVVRTRLVKHDGRGTMAKCPRCGRFLVVPGLRIDMDGEDNLPLQPR